MYQGSGGRENELGGEEPSALDGQRSGSSGLFFADQDEVPLEKELLCELIQGEEVVARDVASPGQSLGEVEHHPRGQVLVLLLSRFAHVDHHLPRVAGFGVAAYSSYRLMKMSSLFF